MCISVSVSVCVRVIMGKRKKDNREKERYSKRPCVSMCNHLTANGRSERLWHHAGLQSCGLTSTANQQTARASQWMTAKSLGDEASCWGQRAVVLALHQCTDKTEQHIHATHRLQRSLHPSLFPKHVKQHYSSTSMAWVGAEAKHRAGVLAQVNRARQEAEVEVDHTVDYSCV